MERTITMGQVTYELRRVFQGTRSLSELMAERIARQIPAGSAETGSSGPRPTQNVPAARPVDGGGGHGV